MFKSLRARPSLKVAAACVLSLALGAVGATYLERYCGDGAVYATVEASLLQDHVGTPVAPTVLREACLKAMVAALGDHHTSYEQVAPEESDVPHLVPMAQVQLEGRRFAILKVNDFLKGATAEFIAALKSERLYEADGLVLDLRGNRGGFLEESAAIAAAWVGNRPSGRLTDNHGEVYEFSFETPAILAHVPTAILVNGQTASAAEAFAAALKEYGLARLFGARTFGKGVTTEDRKFAGGSVLHLTQGRWTTPKGNSVQDIGLAPDEKVANEPCEDCAKQPDQVMDASLAWLQKQPKR